MEAIPTALPIWLDALRNTSLAVLAVVVVVLVVVGVVRDWQHVMHRSFVRGKGTAGNAMGSVGGSWPFGAEKRHGDIQWQQKLADSRRRSQGKENSSTDVVKKSSGPPYGYHNLLLALVARY